ncbi:MAG: hypothetical protein Harvfovirus21_15 [Harvfovirus sp.]|uniref:Uncharacterized protein n=1 Tax=Harvfovirus sp. TaxID=2487768 RepID=A0A3G5A1W9_9VIRU|nr:MAG: hypothetical protein Harvfovirus21_15 [Harvfovirus sp.]
MPPKSKAKKKASDSDVSDDGHQPSASPLLGVNGTSNNRATTENMLNLCDISVELPIYDNLTSSEKCKPIFNSVSQNYIKLTDLMLDLDNIRCRLVNNLAEIQKRFKSFNVNNDVLGDKVIQDVLLNVANNVDKEAAKADPVFVEVGASAVSSASEAVVEEKQVLHLEPVVVDEPVVEEAKKKTVIKKVVKKVVEAGVGVSAPAKTVKKIVVKGKTVKKVPAKSAEVKEEVAPAAPAPIVAKPAKKPAKKKTPV